MADNAAQELLAKLSLDLTDFKSAVGQAKDLLADAFKEENERVATSQAATEEAIAGVKTQVELQKQLQAQAATVTAQEKAKTAELQTQIAQQKLVAAQAKLSADASASAKKLELQAAQAAIAAQKLLSEQHAAHAKESLAQLNQLAAAKRVEAAEAAAATAKNTTAQKEQLAVIQKQILALRLKNLEEAKRAGGGHNAGEEVGRGGGLINSLFGSSFGKENTEAISGAASGISRQLFGGGLSGSIAQGMLTGGLTVAAIEGIGESIKGLVEKFQELVPELGKLSQMQNTFEELARGKGIKDTGALLDQIREKTLNLATDTDILRTANTFLQSPLKMTTQDMLRLTEATVNLARANGKSVPEAMQALNQFYLTGRAMSLAHVTQINREALTVRNLGSALTETQRKQEQFSIAAKVIETKSDQLGQTPITYQERTKALEISTARLEEATGQGIMHSKGFNVVNDILDSLIKKFGSLEEVARSFGDSIGNVVGGVVKGAQLLTAGLASLLGVSKDIYAIEESLVGILASLLPSSLDQTSSAANGMVSAFQAAHPVIAGLLVPFAELSAALKTIKLDFDFYPKIC